MKGRKKKTHSTLRLDNKLRGETKAQNLFAFLYLCGNNAALIMHLTGFLDHIHLTMTKRNTAAHSTQLDEFKILQVSQ